MEGLGGWGLAKNNKTGHSGFYDFRTERYKIKIYSVKNLFVLLGFCKMTFLVPYNSKIIKLRISRFVVLSWALHLSILLQPDNEICYILWSKHQLEHYSSEELGNSQIWEFTTAIFINNTSPFLAFVQRLHLQRFQNY